MQSEEFGSGGLGGFIGDSKLLRNCIAWVTGQRRMELYTTKRDESDVCLVTLASYSDGCLGQEELARAGERSCDNLLVLYYHVAVFYHASS